MSRLTVLPSDTYTVDSGDVEEYESADVDGTLEINGQLKLIDDPSTEAHDVDTSPIDLPLAPINLSSMELGLGFFLVSFMALLGGLSAFLRNYAAIIMLAFAMFALIASGLFQIGLELYWAMIAATIFLLMAGAVVRWMA